ncbi:MAG TPA: peptide deformylase [Labilithrix sp.]|jgi:peptide deformylase
MKRAEAQRVTYVPQSGVYARVPLRRVLERPHPVLERRAMEVDPCAPAIAELALSLVATMRVSPACVGLAAPQIGAPVRVFCMDVSGHPKARSCAGLVVMANPIIASRRGNIVLREGCMSVPHLTGNVARAEQVIVEGVEPGTGRALRVEADAFEARCLQHEIDHLDGYVFVERVLDPIADLFVRKTYVRGG